MIYGILIFIFLITSFVMQYWLTKQKKYVGSVIMVALVLIPSAIFLFLNYNDAFDSVEGFAFFLENYGSSGVIALILKTGLILFPTFLHIVLFFYLKLKNKKNTEQMDKMIASDI
ncbi:MAG: hypothetical protein JXB08_02130 [Bacilli bacterium]|nr:hypothetical protein [Bacilli bacterium]MBN2876160.1 hypothetical protein [Bacilli bacterium]